LAQKILAVIQWLPDQIVEFLSGIATDILNLGKDIGGWIIDGLVSAIRAAAGAVADAVRAIIPDVGSIAGGVASSVGGWFKGLVPGLATGGIVTSPTLALIGEAGPEAVIPLDRLHGGGGSTFNITVNAGLGTDGRQVGTQIVSALKQWERTNGSLPLSVSAV
jgi:SLT domain-containing protein